MLLEIFNVEHGACALITTSNGKRVMIDCGHNSTTGWHPGDALVNASIRYLDRLFVMNYDEDHVSGYPNLMERVYVNVLSRNWRVTPETIRYLKSEYGMGPGIDLLVKTLGSTFTGNPSPEDLNFGDTSFEMFANSYGIAPFGFDDENNLSLVLFVTCGHHRIIFPGDMEVAGWHALLFNQQFAQYHGRENGYCEQVLDLCRNIELVVISDKPMEHETQETVDRYRQYARGILYNGKPRHVLTTRRDGYVRFSFNPVGGGEVFLQNGGA